MRRPRRGVDVWWRVARAARTFPREVRGDAWRAAWVLAGDLAVQNQDHRCREGAARRAVGLWGFGEPLGGRRCHLCCTDDVAHDGWVGVGTRFVCPDCSRAALGGALPYGRCVAAYHGRAGSPRRALGEAYRAVVAFKERRAQWTSLAVPLARALAASVLEVMRVTPLRDGRAFRPLLVPVPSFENRRPHVHMLASLASIKLPHVILRLGALEKTRDFAQKGLSRTARLQESDGAYVVRGALCAGIIGRRIIVADDLMTTGATLEACARVLLAAGAEAVDGATVVRVIRAPPERVVALGSRQVRLQLRELDARGRVPVEPESGVLWVVFACSPRCPVSALAGPYPLPTFDAVSYHRWLCRCGRSHLIRIRREWRGALRESVAVGVGERRPGELLVGIVQGQPRYL